MIEVTRIFDKSCKSRPSYFTPHLKIRENTYTPGGILVLRKLFNTIRIPSMHGVYRNYAGCDEKLFTGRLFIKNKGNDYPKLVKVDDGSIAICTGYNTWHGDREYSCYPILANDLNTVGEQRRIHFSKVKTHKESVVLSNNIYKAIKRAGM